MELDSLVIDYISWS